MLTSVAAGAMETEFFLFSFFFFPRADKEPLEERLFGRRGVN